MTLTVHFVNVGQGNMQVIIFPDNFVLVYDCNISNDNERQVFEYLKKIMPKANIDLFINSHRDADHMRGIKKLNSRYPVHNLWDTEVSSNTGTPEYEEYMDFRRGQGANVCTVKPKQHLENKPYVRILNGARDNIDNPNAQSIVIHIDYNGSSVLLTGDTDAQVWKDYIIPECGATVKANILLASHHGSRSFIDHDSYTHYYTEHLKKIDPDFTIISVGDNSHELPNKEAIKYYAKYTSGSEQGNQIFTTQNEGNIRLELTRNGSWRINKNQ